MYNKYRGDLHVKPRIFVSSTFYDLKYIREDLANFIKAHDFEPIMFEEGDVGYTPGQELDDSCYEAMRNADMAILIVGGQYGSAASKENKELGKFVSITRNEFRNAAKNNVPVFCFIDNSVCSEYGIYKSNKNTLEKNPDAIIFNSTKNINVFRFIEEIYDIGNIPISSFQKSEDIKEFMAKQWSDMFKKYLMILKENQTNHLLNDTVDNMNTILKQMKIMVDKIGEKTIIDLNEYKSVIDEQQEIKIEHVVNLITKGILLEVYEEDLDNKDTNVEKLLNCLTDSIENNKKISECIRSGLVCLSSIYSPTITNDKMLIDCLLNSELREVLKQKLIVDENYYCIFTDDMHKIDPSWDDVLDCCDDYDDLC